MTIWSSDLEAEGAVKPVDAGVERPMPVAAATNFRRSRAMSSLRRGPAVRAGDSMGKPPPGMLAEAVEELPAA